MFSCTGLQNYRAVIKRLLEKSSWVEIVNNCLSYALGLRGAKKLIKNYNIMKTGHGKYGTTDTSKPEHFNKKLPPKRLKFPGFLVMMRKVNAKIKCCNNTVLCDSTLLNVKIKLKPTTIKENRKIKLFFYKIYIFRKLKSLDDTHGTISKILTSRHCCRKSEA